ncbi:MAG TPA: class I SAM-dependent methyltransferase [Phycisphaerales bacterium]|nr:class I SAM-dependent methyltransferase [Phycisphaerales bacterium]
MPTLAAHPSCLHRLRSTREALYTSGRILGEDDHPRDLWPVGLTHERGQALRDLVIRERATRCLETGFAFGLSASFLLEGSLTVQPEPIAHPRVTSIDPFQTTQWRGAGRRFLKEAGLTLLHTLLEFRSESALPQLISEHGGGQQFDFAFIDGDHRFESAFLDIFFARRLLGPGKLIVVDDAWIPAIQKAAAFFTSATLCRQEPTPEGSPLSKFILLHVDAEGDAREWDHFAQF